MQVNAGKYREMQVNARKVWENTRKYRDNAGKYRITQGNTGKRKGNTGNINFIELIQIPNMFENTIFIQI